MSVKSIGTDRWHNFIKPDEKKSINYLQIGSLYRTNITSVLGTYAKNPLSLVHCIDHWLNYTNFREYKGKFDNLFQNFFNNLEEEDKNKLIIHCGYSHIKIPELINNFFDIIFIDGDLNSEYVLENAVLAFRKLKINGIMIINKLNETSLLQNGIRAFISCYASKIEIIGEINGEEVFLKKIKPHF